MVWINSDFFIHILVHSVDVGLYIDLLSLAKQSSPSMCALCADNGILPTVEQRKSRKGTVSGCLFRLPPVCLIRR